MRSRVLTPITLLAACGGDPEPMMAPATLTLQSGLYSNVDQVEKQDECDAIDPSTGIGTIDILVNAGTVEGNTADVSYRGTLAGAALSLSSTLDEDYRPDYECALRFTESLAGTVTGADAYTWSYTLSIQYVDGASKCAVRGGIGPMAREVNLPCTSKLEGKASKSAPQGSTAPTGAGFRPKDIPAQFRMRLRRR